MESIVFCFWMVVLGVCWVFETTLTGIEKWLIYIRICTATNILLIPIPSNRYKGVWPNYPSQQVTMNRDSRCRLIYQTWLWYTPYFAAWGHSYYQSMMRNISLHHTDIKVDSIACIGGWSPSQFHVYAMTAAPMGSHGTLNETLRGRGTAKTWKTANPERKVTVCNLLKSAVAHWCFQANWSAGNYLVGMSQPELLTWRMAYAYRMLISSHTYASLRFRFL